MDIQDQDIALAAPDVPQDAGRPPPSQTIAAFASKDAANRKPNKGAATVHDAGNTTWWFDARGVDDPSLLREAEEGNCTHLVLLMSQLDVVRTRKQRVVWVEAEADIKKLPADTWALTPHDAVRAAAVARGLKAGLMVEVADLQSGFPACVSLCERGDDFVVIDIEHATYIPYELLIAKAERSGTQVLRSVPIRGLQQVVGEVDQSLNALATMEQGVGVLFRSRDARTLRALAAGLRSRQTTRMQLAEAEVIEVRHTGLGHRVCVDTTSLMTADEGMIVGSTGWGGIFVCSETHFLPHMNLREFRVNAGGVHSYVWAPDGKALYLSEVAAGSEVLCVNRDGTARVVIVGRAKVERRPLLQVTCRVSTAQLSDEIRRAVAAEAATRRRVTPDGETIAGSDEHHVIINTFLQNDWHVRVMGADGIVRHGTLLQPGDKVLAHVDLPGRHTGLRVTEHIVEK
ncbi:MAG: 3-dehydroquinate synthase II [Burkholderiaceae bacterium]